ncbi:alpha/beta hydrolase [Synechocystis sp. B12]|nr:alpha/beta hydrolase [Synechocystis sp. B12]
MKNSELYWIDTPGHFPHLANPTEITKAIADYLQENEFV